MDCAGFDSELTALMAGEVAEEERAAALDALRRHAAGCASCSGADDLLELMALPPGERDIVADPGLEYWASFDARLDERLRAEGAERPQASGHGSGLRWLAVAAALVLMSSAVWLALRAPSESTDVTWTIAENLEAEAETPPLELPGEVATLLDGMSPDVAADLLGDFTGLDGPFVLPPPEAAGGQAFDALLAGLDSPRQLSLLEDWLSGDEGAFGIAPAMAPFPDPHDLDGETRKELLQWLSEQV